MSKNRHLAIYPYHPIHDIILWWTSSITTRIYKALIKFLDSIKIWKSMINRGKQWWGVRGKWPLHRTRSSLHRRSGRGYVWPAGRIETAAGKPDDAEDVGGELCKEAIQSVSDLPACWKIQVCHEDELWRQRQLYGTGSHSRLQSGQHQHPQTRHYKGAALA